MAHLWVIEHGKFDGQNDTTNPAIKPRVVKKRIVVVSFILAIKKCFTNVLFTCNFYNMIDPSDPSVSICAAYETATRIRYSTVEYRYVLYYVGLTDPVELGADKDIRT